MEFNKKWEIEIYCTENGKEPFVEWLNGLDTKLRAKVYARLHSVQIDNFSNCKSLGHGISELKFSDGIIVYYSVIGKRIILLLCGGGKNTKREQNNDITRAEKFLADYNKRRTKC